MSNKLFTFELNDKPSTSYYSQLDLYDNKFKFPQPNEFSTSKSKNVSVATLGANTSDPQLKGKRKEITDDGAVGGSKKDPQSWDYITKSLIAGGFGGGLAKTTMAPLERVKILLQTNHAEFVKYIGKWKGIPLSLRQIIKTEGFRGLYRGHSLTLVRAVPHAALGYTVYDQVKHILMPTKEYETPIRRFLCGTLAGCASLPFTYPFELIRVRMAIDTKRGYSNPGAFRAIYSIYHEGHLPPESSPASTPNPNSSKPMITQTRRGLLPIFQFYRGFSVSLIGTVPYRGTLFLTFETLHSYARSSPLIQPFTKSQKTLTDFLIGSMSGSLAMTLTYPLEVVRRLQQVGGSRDPTKMLKFWAVVKEVNTRSGWRGFYVGLGLGLLKQTPMNAISLTSWAWMKRQLGI